MGRVGSVDEVVVATIAHTDSEEQHEARHASRCN
jgi:hypothetical protein